jgi:hypothetical protein
VASIRKHRRRYDKLLHQQRKFRRLAKVIPDDPYWLRGPWNRQKAIGRAFFRLVLISMKLDRRCV